MVQISNVEFLPFYYSPLRRVSGEVISRTFLVKNYQNTHFQIYIVRVFLECPRRFYIHLLVESFCFKGIFDSSHKNACIFRISTSNRPMFNTIFGHVFSRKRPVNWELSTYHWIFYASLQNQLLLSTNKKTDWLKNGYCI